MQSEKYLGVLVGSSYWKTHGVRCSQEQQMNNSVQGEEGSAVLSNSSGMEIVDSDSDDCLVAYSTVETVHAAIYAFIAVSSCRVLLFLLVKPCFYACQVISFILCTTFLLCPRRSNQIEDFDDDEECRLHLGRYEKGVGGGGGSSGAGICHTHNHPILLGVDNRNAENRNAPIGHSEALLIFCKCMWSVVHPGQKVWCVFESMVFVSLRNIMFSWMLRALSGSTMCA